MEQALCPTKVGASLCDKVVEEHRLQTL